MIPLGVLLAAGALGLLAGFVVPTLETLAAAGLVLYFLGARAPTPGRQLPARRPGSVPAGGGGRVGRKPGLPQPLVTGTHRTAPAGATHLR